MLKRIGLGNETGCPETSGLDPRGAIDGGLVKNTSFLVLALGLVSAAAMALPSPTPTPPQASASSAGPCSAIVASTGSTPCAAGTQLMTGTVWAYRPGQSITIRVDEGKQYEMALEPGVRVDGSVAVGHLASLMWTTDNAGKTRVMSITAAPGSAIDIEHSAPSVSTPTRSLTLAPSTSTPAAPSATPTARRTRLARRPRPRLSRSDDEIRTWPMSPRSWICAVSSLSLIWRGRQTRTRRLPRLTPFGSEVDLAVRVSVRTRIRAASPGDHGGGGRSQAPTTGLAVPRIPRGATHPCRLSRPYSALSSGIDRGGDAARSEPRCRKESGHGRFPAASNDDPGGRGQRARGPALRLHVYGHQHERRRIGLAAPGDPRRQRELGRRRHRLRDPGQTAFRPSCSRRLCRTSWTRSGSTGTTQPGASPNSNPPGQGFNTVLKIEVEGTGSVSSPCFTVAAGNADVIAMVIQGLAINRCSTAIVVTAGGDFAFIRKNFIGTDASGGSIGPVSVNGGIRRHRTRRECSSPRTWYRRPRPRGSI